MDVPGSLVPVRRPCASHDGVQSALVPCFGGADGGGVGQSGGLEGTMGGEGSSAMADVRLGNGGVFSTWRGSEEVKRCAIPSVVSDAAMSIDSNQSDCSLPEERTRAVRPVRFLGFGDEQCEKQGPSRSRESGSMVRKLDMDGLLQNSTRDLHGATGRMDVNIVPSISVCDSSNVLAIEGFQAVEVLDNAEVNSVPSTVVPWKTRNVAGTGPDFREKKLGRESALEMAMLKFADRSSEYIINPEVGTEFDHFDEAYEYYNLYSWERGFGIRWGKKRYSDNKENRKLPLLKRYKLSQEFNCSCSGVPEKDLKTASTRTNCSAKLRLGRTSDNGWIVVEHVDEHNHELSEMYGENRLWPSHHHLDKYTKDLIKMLRHNNVGVTKLYSILGSFFGKMQNVPTTKRCLRNICQKINKEESENDINKTLSYFSDLMKDDPGFKYIIDRDAEGRIKTLLWSNTRSRMQYASFGDAITFDTTYKTNMYDMPFGLFVGVNNHFQSILLGGVLMTDETVETFRWIFREFTKLMGGKKPDTILTDQCRAMEVAIAVEWEGTVHRWCKWHVLKRIAECLGQKYTGDRDFRDKFHRMLNEMMIEEEFLTEWDALLKEYGLQENDFLKQIHAVREKWVKCYFLKQIQGARRSQ